MEMLHDIFIGIRFNERRSLKASAKTWPPLNLNELEVRKTFFYRMHIFLQYIAGVPVAFKTWWGQAYKRYVPWCNLSLLFIAIELTYLPKLGEDQSPCPDNHRRACIATKLPCYQVPSLQRLR